MRGLQARPAVGAALFGAALVLAAGMLDAEPLYVPGIAFIALAVGACAWVLLVARGVRVRRTVAARRVQEDEPVVVTLDLVSRRPLPGGAIVDDLLPEWAAVAPGRRTQRVRVTVRFARRGARVLPGARAAVRDALGLATWLSPRGDEAEILVLPRVEPVALTGAGEGDGTGARRGRPAVAAEVDMDGLRPWREGTPASRIFWPALARGGELLERRMAADSDTRPLIVLDARGAADRDDEDAAIRAATSLAVHLARVGGCALLLPGDRRPVVLDATLAGWAHVHARLALADARAAPSLGLLPGRRGPVLYVSARRLTRAPRALGHAPAGARVLVVPGALPARRAIFTVAGCTGHELSPVVRRPSRSRSTA